MFRWFAQMNRIMQEVVAERFRQEEKFPGQQLPDGNDTSAKTMGLLAKLAKNRCDQASADGVLTWHDVLLEEVAEALAETDQDALREELIQVAAVAMRWAQDIDRRLADSLPERPTDLFERTAREALNPGGVVVGTHL